MFNVREYMRKKENAQSRSLKKEIARHRLTVFYKIAAVFLAIVVVIGIVLIQSKNKIYKTYQIVTEIQRKVSDNALEKEFAGNILTYSKDGANCTDIKGTVLWNQTYEMQTPMVDINGTTAAIGDYNGHTIHVVETSGIMGEIETGMPIRNFCVATNGVVAAMLDDAGITWITVFDSKGTKILEFKTTMKSSGYPIDLAISSDGMLLSISYLYVDSGTMKTKVAFYNFGEVGKNKIDTLVGAYEYADAIVPEIQFMNDSTIFALADNRLMTYKGKQIPTHQAEVILSETIQGVYHSDKYIGLLYLNAGGGEKYRLDVYNETCKLVKSILFNIQYKDILIKNETITIYNDLECLIYTTSGVKKFEGKFNEAIRTLIPTTKQEKYVGITTDKIQIIELR